MTHILHRQIGVDVVRASQGVASDRRAGQRWPRHRSFGGQLRKRLDQADLSWAPTCPCACLVALVRSQQRKVVEPRLSVRGQKGDIRSRSRDVRFTPQSRHRLSALDVRYVPKPELGVTIRSFIEIGAIWFTSAMCRLPTIEPIPRRIR
jgi:hypothetical protein